MLFLHKKLIMFCENFMNNKTIKPKALKKGDLIGIVAPAGPAINDSNINKAINYLEKLGYRVEIAKHVFQKYGYLAGHDINRANDLNEYFKNKNIKAIFTLRGGYGSMRILKYLDYKSIKENPKIFVGHSDITSLQFSMYKNCSLLTFHGPMIETNFPDNIDPLAEELFWSLLSSKKKIGNILQFSKMKIEFNFNKTIRGKIFGGNLSIITSLVGTNYFPDLKHHILVLEEIDEAPYRVDRMLQQLRYSGKIKKINGVIIGDFSTCIAQNKSKSLSLDDVIEEIFTDVPIIKNFDFGHVKTSLTIPQGLKVEISYGKKIQAGSLRFLEAAVI